MATIILAVAFMPGIAHGQDSASVALEVSVSAPGRCPNHERLRREVSARLGDDPFAEPGATDVPRIEIDITTDGGQEPFRGRVVARTRHGELLGERELVAARCSDLTRPLALAIAIAVDSVALTPADPASGPPAPEPRAPPPSEDSPPEARSTQRSAASVGEAEPSPSMSPAPAPVAPADPGEAEARSALRVGVAVATRVSLGYGPGITGGLGVGAALAVGPWRVHLEGHLQLPSEVRRFSGTLRASFLVGSLVGCRALLGPLHGCLLVEVGALRAEGQGYARARAVALPHVASGVRVELVPDLGPFYLAVRLEGLAAITRSALQVQDDLAWTTSPFVLSATLALGYWL